MNSNNCNLYIKYFNDYQDQQPINESRNFKEKPSNSYQFLALNLKSPKFILYIF